MDKRYETWADVQATPGFVELTGFMTSTRLSARPRRPRAFLRLWPRAYG
jgi:hypothetical protein